MSGRLTILPKKTYCPWKPENVERVLRDERLERERLEREAKANADANAKQRRRRLGGEETAVVDGHINLFPEAREAELKLATGQGPPSNANNNASLGGDEATKRKMGSIPFYMRSSSSSNKRQKNDTTGGGSKYGNDSNMIHGMRNRNNVGASIMADEITSKIMSDQYERREDSRKDKMDPMSQFYVASSGSRGVTSSQNAKANNNISFDTRDVHSDALDATKQKRYREKRHVKKHQKKKRHRSYSEDKSDCSAHSYSFSDTSTSDDSSTRSDNAKGRRSRKQSKHRSRSKDRRSRRKHRKESKRRHRHRHRHRSSSVDSKNSNHDRKKNNELEELRRKRHAREARETERERQLLVPPAATGTSAFVGNGALHGGIDGRYHDQFNPTLSRN